MIQSTYNLNTFLAKKTQNGMYKWLEGFLNENNVEIFICFQY